MVLLILVGQSVYVRDDSVPNQPEERWNVWLSCPRHTNSCYVCSKNVTPTNAVISIVLGEGYQNVIENKSEGLKLYNSKNANNTFLYKKTDKTWDSSS